MCWCEREEERCRKDRDDHQRRAGWKGPLVKPWCVRSNCEQRKQSEREVAAATCVEASSGMVLNRMASKQGQRVADSQEAADDCVFSRGGRSACSWEDWIATAWDVVPRVEIESACVGQPTA